MQWPPSVCLSVSPSVRLFPVYRWNRLTVDFELLLVSRSCDVIEGQFDVYEWVFESNQTCDLLVL